MEWGKLGRCERNKNLTFEQYAREARNTAGFPELEIKDNDERRRIDPYVSWVYPLIGLTGEVGELSNKLKKIIRDETYPETRDLISELGDILWYWAMLAETLGLDPKEIAVANITKLATRRKNNTIKGSGDNR